MQWARWAHSMSDWPSPTSQTWGPGENPGFGQGLNSGSRCRLVFRGVGGTHDRAEMFAPAEMRGFPAQIVAGFVADHRKINSQFLEPVNGVFRTAMRLQKLQMVFGEVAIKNAARFLPAVAEQFRETIAQGPARFEFRLFDRPGRFAHRRKSRVHRGVN